MLAKKTVLIAEDFEGQHSKLAGCLREHGARVELCNSENISLEIGAVKYSPSIIVTDCCLCGWQEALSFADKLRESDIRPLFYNIYTYEDSETIRILLDNNNFVNISLPYSAEAVCEDMLKRLEAIPINAAIFKDEIHKSVSELLIALGITPRNTGYDNIRYIICYMLLEGGKGLRTYELYDKAAEKYNGAPESSAVSRQSVERSIRISVSSGWKRSSRETRLRYFPQFESEGRKPSNTEFLKRTAELIEERYSEAFRKYYDLKKADVKVSDKD